MHRPGRYRAQGLCRLALAVCLASGIGAAAQAEEAPAGMRIYRDPDSGVIGAPPPGAATAAAPAAAAALAVEAADELYEEPVTAPAGGTKLKLRGRYPSSIQRQVGSAGGHAPECTGPVGGR